MIKPNRFTFSIATYALSFPFTEENGTIRGFTVIVCEMNILVPDVWYDSKLAYNLSSYQQVCSFSIYWSSWYVMSLLITANNKILSWLQFSLVIIFILLALIVCCNDVVVRYGKHVSTLYNYCYHNKNCSQKYWCLQFTLYRPTAQIFPYINIYFEKL